jgi:hypothetical protein
MILTVLIQSKGSVQRGSWGSGRCAGGGEGGAEAAAAACLRRILVFRPAGREEKILVAISTGFVSFYMIEFGKDETDWCYKTLWFEGRKEGKV